MSGHSHFSTIKRQKAINDAAKGNLFSKMARSIMLAAKSGPDPDMNFRLRFEIDKARAASMPKENIERAIAKATTDSANLEEIVYEGFGPGGFSVLVDVATDNKNRSAQEMKTAFDKSGGVMAGKGAVAFNFEKTGFLLVKKNDNVEEQILKIMDSGASDVIDSEDGIEVFALPELLSEVREHILKDGYEIIEVEVQMKPKTLTKLSGEALEKAEKFIDSLESLDDVNKVYTNIDV
jgi:YebC/PmpR family DNA-binding regulatory protein